LNTVSFRAGKLKHHLPQWKAITTDKKVLSIVEGYKIPLISNNFSSPVNAISYSYEDEQCIFTSVRQLLAIDAISTCNHTEGEFISPIFLVPKSDGTKRFILNLKKLNLLIPNSHFKMEDLRVARRLISIGTYLASIDLKDAYFHVPIHEDSKKLLRFKWDGILYEFNCLPFGLSTAPRIFTKLMKPVFHYLRNTGFSSVNYLDDFLLLEESYSDCCYNVLKTRNLLESLGFSINFEKSCLQPSQTITFLGFNIDSKLYVITLPLEKQNNIKNLCSSILKKPRCKIRVFAKLIGVLVSATPAFVYGMLYTKTMEREKFLNLRNSNQNFESTMTISETVRNDIKWWLRNLENCKSPIYSDNFDLCIYSDASKSGWGASTDSQGANGWWSDHEASSSINFLELQAAFFGLKSFATNYRNSRVLLRIDNTTAISYINRMGGVQFPKLNDLARKIWKWCEDRQIWVFASYISSKVNVKADFESRRQDYNSEWSLDPVCYAQITKHFQFYPTVDLFATFQNSKCKTYVSWRPDPGSSEIDAFTLRWNKSKFYIFPPFALILKTLKKLESDGAFALVIVPFWPVQPWFPLYVKLCKGNFIKIPPSSSLLTFCDRSHPLWKTLTLAAGVLSSNL